MLNVSRNRFYPLSSIWQFIKNKALTTLSDCTHGTCAFRRGNFSLIKIIPIVVSIRRVRLLWSATRAIWSALVLFSARVYPSCSYPNELCTAKIMVLKSCFYFRIMLARVSILGGKKGSELFFFCCLPLCWFQPDYVVPNYVTGIRWLFYYFWRVLYSDGIKFLK